MMQVRSLLSVLSSLIKAKLPLSISPPFGGKKLSFYQCGAYSHRLRDPPQHGPPMRMALPPLAIAVPQTTPGHPQNENGPK